MQDFKAVVLNESIIETINSAVRKLDKMQSLLPDFLNQQFLLGEVHAYMPNAVGGGRSWVVTATMTMTAVSIYCILFSRGADKNF